MKKRYVIALVILLVLCFTGFSDYKESNGAYMVSALGFSPDGNKVTVFAQTLIVSEASADEKVQVKVFSSSGDNCRQALYNLSAELPKAITFDHLSIILISGNLEQKYTEEILSITENDESVNLSVYYALCENPREILETNSASAVASGFDIVHILEHEKNEKGIDFYNRHYEIEKTKNSKSQSYSLPVFAIKGENISLLGQAAYSYSFAPFLMSEEESVCFAILKDFYKGGKVQIKNESAVIDKCHTSYSFKKNGERVSVKIKTYITAGQMTKGFRKAIKENSTALINRMKQSDIGDILGIKERIKGKNKQLYQSLKNESIFKTCDIEYEIRTVLKGEK